MCVIAHIPKRQVMGWDEVINCFTNNPDGAGYMFADDNMVVGDKGFFSVGSLLDSLGERGFLSAYGVGHKDKDICIHFRWATHGEINAQNCHPFPLTYHKGRVLMTEWVDTVGVAHNGIIFGKESNGRLSDTQQYILRRLYIFKDRLEVYVKTIQRQTQGNKFLFMLGDGRVFKTGGWVTFEGVHYTNDDYKVDEWKAWYRSSYGDYGGYGNYGKTDYTGKVTITPKHHYPIEYKVNGAWRLCESCPETDPDVYCDDCEFFYRQSNGIEWCLLNYDFDKKEF